MTVPASDDVAVRVRALQAEALRARAGRLATCCTPSGLRRAGSAFRAWARHGNLAVERPCCPWPV